MHAVSGCAAAPFTVTAIDGIARSALPADRLGSAGCGSAAIGNLPGPADREARRTRRTIRNGAKHLGGTA